MNLSFPNTIIRFIFTVCLLAVAVRLVMYHYQLIVFPHPVILRESAMVSSTALLLKGQNPYGFEHQPQYTNVYGIVYPLLVWPWAAMGGATLFVHRMVTAGCMLVCLFLVALVLRKRKVPCVLIAAALVMLYAQLLYPGTSTPAVDPACTGLMFMLAAIFIPYLLSYSTLSIFMSVLCGLLAFLSKPYFLICIPVVASYLFFFISKRKAVLYSVTCLIFGAISLWGVNRLFPAYIDNCFFVHKNPAGEWAATERLQSQLIQYGFLHAGLITFTLGYACYQLWLRTKQIVKAPIPGRFMPIDIYAGLCSLLVLLLILGKHGGATLWYFFQLLSPFVIIAAISMMASVRLWPLLALPVLSYSLHVLSSPHVFDKQDKDWPYIQAFVESAREPIMVSPLLAPILLQNKKDIFTNGHSEYFLFGATRDGIWRAFGEGDSRVIQAMSVYLDKIEQMVESRAFNLLIILNCSPSMQIKILQHYDYQGSFKIYAPQDRKMYDHSVWVPRLD